jgi:hypothetical protein
MTCESVGIRRTAVELPVVGGFVGDVVGIGGGGGLVVAVGGAVVDGASLGGAVVVGVVVGAVVGPLVEGAVEVVVGAAEVAGLDEEGFGSAIDVPVFSLSVLHATSATASVATPSSRATLLEDRAVPLTIEP